MPVQCVFVVEDHPVMRAGYAYLIDREPDLKVCGVARLGEEALELLPDSAADVVLTGLDLPDMAGIDMVRDLREAFPELPVLVVSAHDEVLYAEQVLAAGAQGYLMKEEPVERVLEAIRHVLGGRLYLSGAMRERIVLRQVGRGPSRPAVEAMTGREMEVFRLFGNGQTTRGVAERMGLSVKTIESHRTNIKRKLGIVTASEFVQQAVVWAEQSMAQDEHGKVAREASGRGTPGRAGSGRGGGEASERS